MNLAIIPARSQSERIKNKNIKFFFGKPIISYAIELALKSKIFSNVVVSTDSKHVAQISKSFGAEIYFLRPSCLSDNLTSIVDVVAHSIVELKKIGLKFNFVCCIFPVSPMLNKKILKDSLSLLKKESPKYVFPVTLGTMSNQNKIFLTKRFKVAKNINNKNIYFDAGQFYWARSKVWIKKTHIFGEKSKAILLNKEFIDVNYPEDWREMTRIYKKYGKKI
jgi:pseudaminic acid cytidylyltransferase